MCLETLFVSATSSTSTSYYSTKPKHNKATTINNEGRTLHATTVGKPTFLTGKTALAKLLAQCPDNTTEKELEIWTVGDNPYSDVALAHTMGWKSALLRLGYGMEMIHFRFGEGRRKEEGVMPAKVEDSFASFLSGLIPE